MSVLEDLRDTLVADLGLVFGTDLFINFMPGNPDEVTGLYEVPGGERASTFGKGALPIFEVIEIQVRTRAGANDSPTAKSRGTSAWQALATISDETINGTRYMDVSVLDGPFIADKDSNDRPTFVTNMQVMKYID